MRLVILHSCSRPSVRGPPACSHVATSCVCHGRARKLSSVDPIVKPTSPAWPCRPFLPGMISSPVQVPVGLATRRRAVGEARASGAGRLCIARLGFRLRSAPVTHCCVSEEPFCTLLASRVSVCLLQLRGRRAGLDEQRRVMWWHQHRLTHLEELLPPL